LLLSLCIAFFAVLQASVYWGAIALCFAVLIHLTYRQYLAEAECRAKQGAGVDGIDRSENYVRQLEQYVGTLERSTAALQESHEKFREEACYDPLTGLANRKMIVESLELLLSDEGGTDQAKFAVLYINLNRFRMINEGLSHATGDRIIKQMAKRICDSVGEDDRVGHFGGDEFVVLLADVEDPTCAIKTADAIATRVSEVIRFRNREVYTSASIGIVFASGEYKRAEDILRDADIAMYNAKDSQKKWAIFDRAMHSRTVERQQLETDLRYAIVCGELELFYQPIIHLADDTLSGFEALVRWNHPKRGLVMPSEFIPLAESTGLIAPMSMQILKDSCLQLAEWEGEFGDRRPLMMSVNISVANLADSNLLAQLESILNETGIRRASLKLEITESAVMKDAEGAIELLKRIKATGVSLSIDDFGTGYSSLSYLQKFPLDYLKIDRSFVSEMENGGENEEIVRTIIALAKALKLEIVAEGIETTEQQEKLRDLGCEFGQGFYFSRPLTADRAEALLREGGSWTDLLATDDVFGSFDSGMPIHLESTH
jgi:diguanylate cyclase (GGDEF)-like protein